MQTAELSAAQEAAGLLLDAETALGVSIDFFLERVHSVDCFLLDGNRPTLEEITRSGFSVTVRHRGATGEVAVNSISVDALRQGLAAAAERAGVTGLPLDRLAAAVRSAVGPSGVPPRTGGETDTLWKVYDTARREGPLTSVAVSYSGELREFLALGPGRTHREVTLPRYLLSGRAIAEGETVGYRKIGTRDADEWQSGHAAADVGREAGSSALRKRGAVQVQEEDAVLVIAAGASGVLAHELVGHPLEADVAAGGLAGVRWESGDRIGPAGLSVADDPGLPGAWGSYAHDDTGVAAARCPVVEDGVVTRLIDGTGRQRRQSFRCPPLPRMSNVVMEPGPDDPAALTGSVRSGYHVARLGAGMLADDGVFSVGAVNIHRIRDGRLAEPVADSVISGHVADALRNIRGIGSDFALGGPASCGKYGQGVPVGDGGPTLLMTGLTIEPAPLK
ncbi:TldD/PmbA family protein [Streptomyces bambusae]|uniref:TldD/PmbA family protein n=1 Tax=Streptomyces bambusae TaxID=1550616 RepID=UPI001CFF96F5|nr:TldD/PmbA family protein [Streptomyces bambusae]MCB5169893.1 TldD/PmbA family protein [Streptomyces bambusae]